MDETSGKTTGMTITLSVWLCQGISTWGVHTVDEDYLLLTGRIERWLYRVARKHAGNQECGWSFTVCQLYKKASGVARFSDFVSDVRKVVEANGPPGYALETHCNAEGDEIASGVFADLTITTNTIYIHLQLTDSSNNIIL